MLYQACKHCLHYIFTLYYSKITVINQSAIPENESAIVYSNHRSFLADAAIQISLNTRVVRTIVAVRALQQPGLNFLIKLFKSIPVLRHVDVVFSKGPGKIIELKDRILIGKNTKFTDIIKESSILVDNESKPTFAIKNIIDDSHIEIEEQNQINISFNCTYHCKNKPDFQKMYFSVWSSLKNKDTILIYPEGTSHDLLQFRPFKPGISIIALGAQQNNGPKIQLIPCIFHYYDIHTFRSHVIVQYGTPFGIPSQIMELCSTDKREATNKLLALVEKNMKKLSLEFDQVDELHSLYLARQLYTLDCEREVTMEQKLELNRRFAKGFMLAREDPAFTETYKKLTIFSVFLKEKGISVRSKIKVEDYSSICRQYLFSILMCLIWFVLMSPGLFLWMPIALLACYMANRERLYWFNLARIQQHCYHVVPTFRIFFLLMFLPLMYIAMCIILYPICKKYKVKRHWWKFCLVLLIFEASYALMFVKCWDRFVIDWKKMKFMHLKIFHPAQITRFERDRRQLKEQIHGIVEQLGQRIVPGFQQNRILWKNRH